MHDLGNEDLKQRGKETQNGDSCYVGSSPQLSNVSADNATGRKLDKKTCKKEAQKLKSFYEAQIKTFQQNALKVEANLVNQIYQVGKSSISISVSISISREKIDLLDLIHFQFGCLLCVNIGNYDNELETDVN